MNGIRKAHPTNLSSASQCRALKLTRVQYRSQNGPKFSESGTALCKMCPMPPGWVQDNREKTRPENSRSDAQAMEGEKVKTPHSPGRGFTEEGGLWSSATGKNVRFSVKNR